MEKYKIAVLLTCFNRREKTLICLNHLFEAKIPNQYKIDVFLVDDGSTDGTGNTIRTKFPKVNVLKGTGDLFWNRGMLKAWELAHKTIPDFVLWLNDDTLIKQDAIIKLLDTYKEIVQAAGKSGIVVGVTCDASGILSYGGVVRKSRWRMTKFSRLPISNTSQPCLTMNGNCVLISKDIFETIGLLDGNFQHAMGDLDYGLRATKSGYPIWTTPGYIGTCDNDNFSAGSYKDSNLPLWKRYEKMIGPKGLPPSDWLRFCRKHAGIAWPFFWIWPFMRVLFESFQKRTLKNNI